jgi:hypothetical protein
MPPDAFRDYLKAIEKNLATGSATEHTHRSALKALLEAVGEGITAINEPRRIECGAPDYIITRAKTPVGYVEAKDVGRSLDEEWTVIYEERYGSDCIAWGFSR